MIRRKPEYLILIGFIMVLLGFVFPFLMVMRVLESTFFLNFLSYTMSFFGLIVGIIGAAWYNRSHKGD